MHAHRILGLLTTLASIPPFLVATLLVVLRDFSISNWLVLEGALLGLAALFAGILLWTRHRFMYLIGSYVWALLVIWSLASLVALRAATWTTLYLVVGIPVCAYMVRELWRTRRG